MIMQSDDTPIRKLIADRDLALGRKDMDAYMAHYAPDVVIYDAIPPWKTRGTAAFHRTWEDCLPCFPDNFSIEMRDITIFVHGEIAAADWLWHFTGKEKDHPAMQSWMRNSTIFERKQDTWMIVHEHYSVPFDPNTSSGADP